MRGRRKVSHATQQREKRKQPPRKPVAQPANETLSVDEILDEIRVVVLPDAYREK